MMNEKQIAVSVLEGKAVYPYFFGFGWDEESREQILRKQDELTADCFISLSDEFRQISVTHLFENGITTALKDGVSLTLEDIDPWEMGMVHINAVKEEAEKLLEDGNVRLWAQFDVTQKGLDTLEKIVSL